MSKKKFLAGAEKFVGEIHEVFPLAVKRDEPLMNVFHLVEESRWFYYLNHVAKFWVDVNTASQTEGITHSYGSATKIGINKAFHTPGTVVHELLHYHSHYRFRANFSAMLNEGVTEFFTRKVMQLDGPRTNMMGDSDIYAKEHAMIKALLVNECAVGRLSAAYFLGDLTAINEIKSDISFCMNDRSESVVILHA